jgi:hypothetical protein
MGALADLWKSGSVPIFEVNATCGDARHVRDVLRSIRRTVTAQHVRSAR